MEKCRIGRMMGSAVVVETITKLTAGKFGNRALTAAFATALRADWSSYKDSQMSRESELLFVNKGTAEERARRFKEFGLEMARLDFYYLTKFLE